MEIRQFRVVLKARDFDRTCTFYEEVLSLPRLESWERDEGRGALYRAGTGVIEILGRSRRRATGGRDEDYDYQGPKQKLSLTLIVPSAETAYEQLLFRDRNIPGGLRQLPDGRTIFETHDPDGVKILLAEE